MLKSCLYFLKTIGAGKRVNYISFLLFDAICNSMFSFLLRNLGDNGTYIEIGYVMKIHCSLIKAAVLLSFGLGPLDALSQIQIESPMKGNTLRFHSSLSNGHSDAGSAGDLGEGSVNQLTWAKLYQDKGRLDGVSDDSQLIDKPVLLGGLSLTMAEIPEYPYPVTSVGNIDVSGNQFPNLSFFPSGMMVNGSIDSRNTGLNELTSMLYFDGINGDVYLNDNGNVSDIANLGYLPVSTGNEVVLDVPSQYLRLISESSPLCVAAREGALTVRDDNNAFSFNDYCTYQDDWVRFFNDYGQHSDLVEDSELYAKDAYFKSYMTDADVPVVKYPVPVARNVVFDNYSYLTNADFMGPLVEAETVQLQSVNLSDATGFKNLKRVNGTLAFHVLNTGLTDLSGFEELEYVGNLTFWGHDSTNVLRDISKIENLPSVGEVVFGYKNRYDKLPSADAPLCQYIKSNEIRVKATSKVDSQANYFCDSGSQWQEIMEDNGSIYYRGYVLDQASGVDVQPFELRYYNTAGGYPNMRDDQVPSEPYPNPNPPSIEITRMGFTLLGFLNAIESTEDISLTYNNDLISLSGMEGIEADNVYIYDNDSLTDISAIAGMTINNQLTIVENGSLTDYSPLDDFVSNLKVIRIGPYSSNKTNLSGEGELCKAVSRGDIQMQLSNGGETTASYMCDSHPWIEFLQSRSRIDGNVVSIEQLSEQRLNLYINSLTDAQIPESNYPSDYVVDIQVGNTRLTNVDFLQDIKNAGNSIYVTGNDYLTDISGISSVSLSPEGAGKVMIYNNSPLKDLRPLSNMGDNIKEMMFNYNNWYDHLLDINGTVCQRQMAGEIVFKSYGGAVRDTSYYCE